MVDFFAVDFFAVDFFAVDLFTADFFSTALFSYTYPIAECIACFKYQREHYEGRWLAKLLYDVILDKKQKLPQAIVPVPVPVPLHYKKLQQRGFNQAYELCYFFK